MRVPVIVLLVPLLALGILGCVSGASSRASAQVTAPRIGGKLPLNGTAFPVAVSDAGEVLVHYDTTDEERARLRVSQLSPPAIINLNDGTIRPIRIADRDQAQQWHLSGFSLSADGRFAFFTARLQEGRDRSLEHSILRLDRLSGKSDLFIFHLRGKPLWPVENHFRISANGRAFVATTEEGYSGITAEQGNCSALVWGTFGDPAVELIDPKPNCPFDPERGRYVQYSDDALISDDGNSVVYTASLPLDANGLFNDELRTWTKLQGFGPSFPGRLVETGFGIRGVWLGLSGSNSLTRIGNGGNRGCLVLDLRSGETRTLGAELIKNHQNSYSSACTVEALREPLLPLALVRVPDSAPGTAAPHGLFAIDLVSEVATPLTSSAKGVLVRVSPNGRYVVWRDTATGANHWRDLCAVMACR